MHIVSSGLTSFNIKNIKLSSKLLIKQTIPIIGVVISNANKNNVSRYYNIFQGN